MKMPFEFYVLAMTMFGFGHEGWGGDIALRVIRGFHHACRQYFGVRRYAHVNNAVDALLTEIDVVGGGRNGSRENPDQRLHFLVFY